MGRFIAIVVVLVAVALLINGFLGTPDPLPDPGIEIPDLVIEEGGAPVEEAAPLAEASSPTEPAVSEESEPEESVPEDAERALTVADELALLSEDEELLSGIPGEGDLTVEQIDAWLADAKNHLALKPVLPLGLAAGAGEIQGIEDNPLTRAKIELGRQLYFDTRLSADNTISCASCHAPENGFAKNTQFGVGIEGQEGGRNSPVAYNRILSGPQFWDGRAESLEAQAVGPIANPIEMGNTHEACVETVKGIEGYQKQFAAVFDDGVTIDNVGRAIASFERAIVTGPAPWDLHLEGLCRRYC